MEFVQRQTENLYQHAPVSPTYMQRNKNVFIFYLIRAVGTQGVHKVYTAPSAVHKDIKVMQIILRFSNYVEKAYLVSTQLF